MSCTYTIYSSNGVEAENQSMNELVQMVKDKFLLEVDNLSDIIYSAGEKQEAVRLSMLSKKLESKSLVSNNAYDSQPTYGDKDTITPFALMDSGKLRLTGKLVMLEIREEDYKQNFSDKLKAENPSLSESEILNQVNSTLSLWKVINEDGKDLHNILNNFNFRSGGGKSLFISFKLLLDSKFKDWGTKIFDEHDKFYHKLYGIYKGGDDHVSIILNVTLKALLNNAENGLHGLEIAVHLDNVVIDTNGVIHIYNYKVSTQSPSNEYKVKKDRYTMQAALIRLILAYNGFDTKAVTIHYVPILVLYNEDFSNINNVIFYPDEDATKQPKFKEYSTVAAAFIQPEVLITPIQDNIIQSVNNTLHLCFPDGRIVATGIQKTVNNFIRSEYGSSATSRILRVHDEPGVYYKLYLTDDFSNPINITEKNEPYKNKQIREHVEKHLKYLAAAQDSTVSLIVNKLILVKRTGKLELELGKFQKQLQLQRYIVKILSPYYKDGVLVDDEYQFDWELISDDTLLDAGILVFKNKDGLVDIITLSSLDLNELMNFKGQLNILGSLCSDTDPNLQTVFNYKSSFGNIEAFRTMAIINEVLPLFVDKNIKLGELKVISTARMGLAKIYSLETLNKELYQGVIRIVKSQYPTFQYKNNFTDIGYVNPLDVLIQEKENILSNDLTDNASLSEEVRELTWPGMENTSTRSNRIVQLNAFIESLYKFNPILQSMSPEDIITLSKYGSVRDKVSAKLYIEALNALLYYKGINVTAQRRISKISEYMFKANRVPNRVFLTVVNMYIHTVDNIAMLVRQEYNHINNYTTDFYNRIGFTSTRNRLYGDLVKAFQNMFRRDANNNLLLEFRNPYERDDQPALNDAEKIYLKHVLFDLTKYRSKIYGFAFNFTLADINSDAYISFLKKNAWLFNVPLLRASKASVRSKGVLHAIEDRLQRVKAFWKDKSERISSIAKDLTIPENMAQYEQAFKDMRIENPYTLSDGNEGSQELRLELIDKYGADYFETNIENILADYLDRMIQQKEYNKTLITVKGVLLQNAMIGRLVSDDDKLGVEQTAKMITDYVRVNMFHDSIMEPESKKLIAFIQPFRNLVSTAYIAGNIISAFRDTYNGFLENLTRALSHYQNDIKLRDVLVSYKDVIRASFTSARDITIIDELCKTYRLSNLDVARISDGLTTSHCGILNVENWLYSTLRSPDFLNRMVLFIGKCRTDGCWEAFSLNEKTRQLEYNWRKDKRYAAYANDSKRGTDEWQEARTRYYNAIRVYNLENPDNAIDFSDDLPVAYSNDEVRRFREFSNSIYGAYDTSLKSKYEFIALGLSLGMFTTWMNGMVANYFQEQGMYEDSKVYEVQDTDGSGNKRYMDMNGVPVIEVATDDGIKYVYEETGEEYKPLELPLTEIRKGIPWTVLGIFNTLKYFIGNCGENGLDYAKNAIKINKMEIGNLHKALTDLLTTLILAFLFKIIMDPAYDDYKKQRTAHTFLENSLVDIMYGGISKSGDSFYGPVSLITHIGTANPPLYKATLNLITNMGQAAFGDKTWSYVLTSNLAMAKPFKYAVLAELKKEEKIEKEKLKEQESKS